MKRRRVLLLGALPVAAAATQLPPGYPQDDPLGRGREKDVKLPNGKSQKDEILKSDHKKNLAEAQELVRLSEAIRADIEKNEHMVLSLQTLKKLEDAEKLAKKIRGRMRHY